LTPDRARTVLVLLHDTVLSGATRSVLAVTSLLEERGWRLVFWVSSPSPLRDELTARGYEVHGERRTIAFSLRGLRAAPGPLRRTAILPRYLSSLHALVRTRPPALVHANTIYSIVEAATAKAAGARVLLHAHEIVPPGSKGTAARRVIDVLAAETVAVSQASAASLAVHGSRPRVVFGGTAIPDQAVTLRAHPTPFVVGTVASISPRKGSDLFVDAAERLLRGRGDIRFHMVGPSRDPIDREWGDRLVARAHALGIEHTPDADVPATLPGWDAFVLPSRLDPFPLALLEAMASGLPVIGTRVGGIPEQVAEGCGILVPPDDPNALAEAISRLAEMPPEARIAMGTAARRRVQECFTLERQAAGLDAGYRATIASL
jgi:glycosyltransferase involved in cell wall biosynthesis